MNCFNYAGCKVLFAHSVLGFCQRTALTMRDVKISST